MKKGDSNKPKTRTLSQVKTSKADSSTVILRNAVPKYGNFQTAKKKPKEQEKADERNVTVREMAVNLSHLNKPSGRLVGSMSPVVIRGNVALTTRTEPNQSASSQSSQLKHPEQLRRGSRESVNSNSSKSHGHLPASQKQQATLGTLMSDKANKDVSEFNLWSKPTQIVDAKEKPVSIVDPMQNGQIRHSSPVVSPVSVVSASASSTDHLPQATSGTLSGADVPVNSNNNIFLEQWSKSASDVMSLKEEKRTLKTQLEVQLQVNKELKRLLVASVGEDLCQRVENLITDKAQLSADLGDFAKKMSEDYENLDKVSIQADMWRSKYLASRMMIDELAKGKAFYGMQYQESQRALQELLNERHELRANMGEAYRCLQHVRDAFDPLNTHKSSNFHSSDVIDLAKTIQNLSETIRFRLLPPGPAFHSNSSTRVYEDSLTKGEALAQELLSCKVDPADLGSAACNYPEATPNIVVPGFVKIDRYHPQARFDNLTLNCCGECTGDIKLI